MKAIMDWFKKLWSNTVVVTTSDNLVVFKPSELPSTSKIEYSDYYTIDICPNCKHKLNERKARYYTKCCYLCGFSNGALFTTASVVVRDVYVDGVYKETVVNQKKY